MTLHALDHPIHRPALAAGLRYLLRFLAACFAVRRQRDQLFELSERDLQDIGVSRAQAESEAQRGFWDIAGTGAQRRLGV